MMPYFLRLRLKERGMTLGDTQAHRHVIGEGLLLGKRLFASAAGKGIFRPWLCENAFFF